MLQLTATVTDCDLDTVLAIGYQMRVLLHTFGDFDTPLSQWLIDVARITDVWNNPVPYRKRGNVKVGDGIWQLGRYGKPTFYGLSCCGYTREASMELHVNSDGRRDLLCDVRYRNINSGTHRNVRFLHYISECVFMEHADKIMIRVGYNVYKPLYAWQRPAW